MTRIVLALILAAVCLAVLPLFLDDGQDGMKTVNVIGSTSIQPFAELLAQEFNLKKTGWYVEVQGGGSTAGIQALAGGLADIGMCSRCLKKEETGEFSPIVIARDGLAVVVNRSNPVCDISLSRLRRIFNGGIEDWRDAGGAGGPVRPITREEGSGTRESFMTLVMGKERISRRALVQESNGAVKELVKGDAAAIGYMSLGLVGEDLKILRVEGVEATHENLVSGRYRLSRAFYFVVKGEPCPGAGAFIDFVLSSEGQNLLKSEGLVGAER